ncbi:hypothetical protein [Pantoea phage Nufs112]|nr:hypothetical protein [Pantoea phage Nufs112]
MKIFKSDTFEHIIKYYRWDSNGWFYWSIRHMVWKPSAQSAAWRREHLKLIGNNYRQK